MTSLRSISSFDTVTQLGYMNPKGVLPNQEVRRLGPGIEFRGKIWGKVQSSSPNKRKNLWSSVTTRRKIGKKSQFWGPLELYLKFKGQNLGNLSPIFLEEKFGAKPPQTP